MTVDQIANVNNTAQTNAPYSLHWQASNAAFFSRPRFNVIRLHYLYRAYENCSDAIDMTSLTLNVLRCFGGTHWSRSYNFRTFSKLGKSLLPKLIQICCAQTSRSISNWHSVYFRVAKKKIHEVHTPRKRCRHKADYNSEQSQFKYGYSVAHLIRFNSIAAETSKCFIFFFSNIYSNYTLQYAIYK